MNDIDLVFLLLTLNIFHTFFCNVSFVAFEQVNVSWAVVFIKNFGNMIDCWADKRQIKIKTLCNVQT